MTTVVKGAVRPSYFGLTEMMYCEWDWGYSSLACLGVLPKHCTEPAAPASPPALCSIHPLCFRQPQCW